MNRKRYRWRIVSLVALLLSIAALFALLAREATPSTNAAMVPDVRINEILIKNACLGADVDGTYSDWIELYNAGDAACDLSGWGLSDTHDMPMRWRFPKGTMIEAGGYLLVRATLQDTVKQNGELHTNFMLGLGESVCLSDTSERMIDDFTLPQKLSYNRPIGRLADDAAHWAILAAATPGEKNTNAILEDSVRSITLPDVEFSVPGGVYEDAFTLELSAEPGLIIYYTLDGSDPDQNSKCYTEPIEIRDRSAEPNRYANIRTAVRKQNDGEIFYSFYKTLKIGPVEKAAVVRARTCKNGVLSNYITTETYYISPESSLPLLSIVTDPHNLFDEQDGIYVPGWRNDASQYFEANLYSFNDGNYLSDTAVGAHLSCYDTDGTELFSQQGYIKTVGGIFTRMLPQKNLRLIASLDSDTTDRFSADLFAGDACSESSGELVTEFERLTLRGVGQDEGESMIKDAFIRDIVKDMAFGTQAARFCSVYIDGEYWGMQTLREAYGAPYLASHYGVDGTSAAILSLGENDAIVDLGTERDRADWLSLTEYAKTQDLSNPEAYAYVETQVDLDSLIDYYIAGIYIGNQDWPNHNMRVWRAEEGTDSYYADGRWRFLMYDCEMSYWHCDYNSVEVLLEPDAAPQQGLLYYDSSPYNKELLRALMENSDFRARFSERFYTCLEQVFHPDRVIPLIHAAASTVSTEMDRHIARWNYDYTVFGTIINRIADRIAPLKAAFPQRGTYTREDWESAIKHMCAYAEMRPQKLKIWYETYLERYTE